MRGESVEHRLPVYCLLAPAKEALNAAEHQRVLLCAPGIDDTGTGQMIVQGAAL